MENADFQPLPYLASLHYNLSQTRPEASYFMFYLWKNSSAVGFIFPTDLEGVFSAGLPTHNFEHSSLCTDVVNGLICFYDEKDYKQKMLNITTGEKVTLPRKCPLLSRYPSMSLGFDPYKKEYKLLCITYLCGEVQSEILTFGTNSWGKISNKPLLEKKFKKGTFCVDERIYWKEEMMVNGQSAIQYFDIGDDLAIICRRGYRTLEIWRYNKKDEAWTETTIILPRIQMSELEVIGTVRKTGEILMTTKLLDGDMLQLIFYDLETEKLRTGNVTCPGMPNLAARQLISYNVTAAVSNQVENILPLQLSTEGTA